MTHQPIPLASETLAYRSRGRAVIGARLCLVGVGLVAMLFPIGPIGHVPRSLQGQEDKEVQDIDERKPLYEQEPFDRITLDEQNKNFVLKVVPLPFRQLPSVSPESALDIRLTNKPGKQFRVTWKYIKKVEFFEQILLSEAERLRAEGKLDEAFHFLLELRIRYPSTPGLSAYIERFLVEDSVQLFRTNRLSEALAVLEELKHTNPAFKLPNGRTVVQLISAVAEKLVAKYIDAKDYRSARILLQRLAKDYSGNDLPAVATQTERIVAMATVKRDEALEHLSAKRYKAAQAAARDMFNMWPTIEGGEKLTADIYNQYPMVVVAVSEPVTEPDVRRIENWSARRAGRLTQRTLLEFAGAGPEGGRYVSPVGIAEKSEDRTRLTFRIDSNLPGVSGMSVARRLLALADPASREYSPNWGSIVKQIQVRNVNLVEIDLRAPHVLPEPFLQVPVEPAFSDTAELRAGNPGQPPAASGKLLSLNGQYTITLREGDKIEYTAREREVFRGPAEVVERYLPEPQRALAALRRGDVDVIDRIFPGDAARLLEDTSSDKTIVVRPYASPTLHLLIPNPKNPFMANDKFRRALAYSIDRERILTDDILGGRKLFGCRPISAPFPAPMSDSDTLAYAYDERQKPWACDRSLGKLLTILATKELEEIAKRRKETAPVLKEIVMAHPACETDRVAVQAIAAYWKTIGVKVELKELPAGASDDPEKKYDILYAEVLVNEPIADAQRMFGQDGLAPAQSPFVRQALRNIDQSQSWRDVYQRFQFLHQAIVDDVSVIPLWQVLDHFAFHKRLKGIEERPAMLYQSIQNWQVTEPPKSPT